MSRNTHIILFIIAALVVVGGVGYFNIQNDIKDAAALKSVEKDPIVRGKENGMIEKKQETTTQPDNSVASNDGMAKKKLGAESGVTVSSVPVPNLDRPIVFEENYSAEQKEKVNGQVKILTDALKADPGLFNDWMDLALLLKSVGDYEWAREVWEYAGAIRPGNSLSFANLGVLYGYYLKNPVKAEANLLHAIENEPRFLDFYARLTDFYLEVVKDKGKAADFLNRAIEKYPEWMELKGLREYVGD